MPKTLLILAVLLLSAGMACAEEFKFRGFAWLTPQTEVMAAESAKFLGEEMPGFLTYEVKTEYTDEAGCYYAFDSNGRLGQAGVIWFAEGNAKSMLKEYDKIKKDLTKLYGKPFLDVDFWLSDQDKAAFKRDRGKGLEAGVCGLNTIWETNDTMISLTMQSDRFEDAAPTVATYTNIGITYNSLALLDVMNEVMGVAE